MQIRSYRAGLAPLVAGLALGGALLVPTVASADNGSGITVIGNPRTTSYYDADGNYIGTSTTTDDVTVLGDGITVIGHPTTTQYYDASGNPTGSSHTTQPLTVIGN